MVFRFISRSMQVIVIILLIVGLAYVGACVYSNFIQGEPGEYKVPSINKAHYELVIHNTGVVLFTDDYETTPLGYSLNGYWELVDNKYRYRDSLLIIRPDIFGKITIRER